MSRLIQLQTHPFRLLLYLEWILLGITVLVEFTLPHPPPPPPLPPECLNEFPPNHPLLAPLHPEVAPQFFLLSVLSIAAFGMMGLRLPIGKLSSKVLYTGVGFGLILLAAVAQGRGIGFSPSLLLVLVIRSCLIFKLTGRLIVAGLAFASFLLTLSNMNPPAPPLCPVPPPLLAPASPLFQPQIDQDQARAFFLNLKLNLALLFCVVLVFVLLLVNALVAERQSREKLAMANEQLRWNALRIEDQATLQERNRIAREIHDSLGHSLTAQSIQLENALMFLHTNINKAEAFLTEAKQLGSIALQEVRQSISTLRSEPLRGQSLEDAIASLVDDFRRRTGIEAECKISFSFVGPLPADVNMAVYRIVKEALTNIDKHSGATQVTVHLKAKSGTLYLLVEDNGRGFNPELNTTGFGLLGMRERTVALGGRFQITSTPGAGCRITAYVPLPSVYS